VDARRAALGWGLFGVAAAVATAGVAAAGCGSDRKDLFVRPFDAGAEAEAAAEPDATPDVDPTLGGPCIEDAQCDDGIACTYDRCDATLSRCRNTPDDTQCDDGIYCDGKEKCVLRQGCASGPVVTCQDDDLCTIDRCVEATKSCEHGPRDADGDGDPDDHCVGHADCDDTDGTVSSKVAEVCGNFEDDDCDGVVDETPCSEPANDVCGNALAVSASGTYVVSTVAAKKDYASSCSVTGASAARDVVVAIAAPAGGGASDIEVWAVSETPGKEVSLALETTCGDPASETWCSAIPFVTDARGIARGVAAGGVVYAIVTAQGETKLDVRVDLRAAEPRPANEDCAAPADVSADAPFVVRLIDPAKDLATTCGGTTGELTYRFTLAEPEDVRVFASTLAGSGQAVVSLRDDAACTDELRCRAGKTPPLLARSLPAGPHVLAVSGTSQIDASVLVKTYPPTTPPPNQTCATAPLVPVLDAPFPVDLSDNEDAIKNGCLPGGPNAAYDLELAAASDVLVVGRFPLVEGGAVSLNAPACTTADQLACGVGTTPVRVSKRNVGAGSYRVAIADQQGLADELEVLVRPTAVPTAIGTSDACGDAQAIPAQGGFFTGDTSGATADFSASCDAPGGTIGGARDQLLRLDLAAKQRVVLDMSGSTFTTMLSVRKGASCPGTEVAGGCSIGASASRSFLELTLDPGTYWVQVDGYSGDRGPWNLDVRVLPP
jgi:hypothetical protein